MKQLNFLCVALLLTAASHGQTTVAPPALDLAAVRDKVAKNEAVLIDVREQSEWNVCHLKAAQLIPLSALKDASNQRQAVARLKPEIPIFCHCKAGMRAKSAAQILTELGFNATPIPLAYDSIVQCGFEEIERP